MNITVKRGTAQLDAVVPVDIQLRLNEQLDGGTASFYVTELINKSVNKPLDKYTVTIGDKSYDFVGFDQRAFVRKKTASTAVYKHTVKLTEPTKLLQGVLVDGFAVTQPDPPTKTLKDVVNRVLANTPWGLRVYYLTADTTVVSILENTMSPQFKWNTQTTLFEVLCDVGAVIDAIPRLVADVDGNFNTVTFDFVNESGTQVEALDEATEYGATVEETQYNTALSAVVENLQEE